MNGVKNGMINGLLMLITGKQYDTAGEVKLNVKAINEFGWWSIKVSEQIK